jgi:hypothetical protein
LIYSGNLIRSTGYTGAITDISIFLAQLCQGNRENTWKLWVLLTFVVSFWIGSFVSFFSVRRFTSFSLLINAGVLVLIGGSLIAFLTYELGISIKEALLGTWKWQKAMQSLQSAFQDTSIFLSSAADAPAKLLDHNHDGQQTLFDRQLNAIFTRLDTDHSNTIDETELFEALQKAGMNLTKHECEVMMRHADSDGDGTLSREEWIQIARACECKKKKKASNLSIFSNS